MHIKQLVFENGKQNPELKNYYTKSSLVAPAYLTSNEGLPPYKISMSLETNVKEFDLSFDIVRFRSRVEMTHIKTPNWRIDLTFVKECKCVISTLKQIRDKLFNCKTNLWKYADRVELEFEYVGDGPFAIEMIGEVDGLFEKSITESLYSKSIVDAAGILNPKQLHLFEDNVYGLKQLGKNPIEMTRANYEKLLTTISNVVITEKIDGTRCLFMIYAHQIVAVSNAFEGGALLVKQFKCEKTNLQVILDTEYLDGKYYAFDILYYNISWGTHVPDLHKLRFSERKVLMDEVIKQHDCLMNKHYKFLTNSFKTELREFYEHVSDQSYEIDGIILFNNSGNNADQYKWKPVMTIDFVAKKCPKKLLGITPFTQTDSNTLYMLHCGISKNEYMKLQLPDFRNYTNLFPHVRKERYKIFDDYFPVRFAPSDNTFAYLYWDKNPDLDNCVIELTRVNENWKFVKIRKDRDADLKRKTYYGNNFRYAESIWMSYKNPLDLNALCDEKSNSYFQRSSTSHVEMRKFNNFVKRSLINKHATSIEHRHPILADLAGGKGQDFDKYINAGFKHILMIDNDQTALTELINRKHMYMTGKMRVNEKCSSELIIANLDLNKPYKKTLDSLSKTFYVANTYHMVVCNFALHYLMANRQKMRNICNLIQQMLRSHGVFMFTAFDGQTVFDELKDVEKWERETGGGVTHAIRKKFKVSRLKTSQKIEVKLPFTDKYYTETLVNASILTAELEKRGIHLVETGSFSDYFGTFKSSQKKYKLSQNDKDYVSLYHYWVYRS